MIYLDASGEGLGATTGTTADVKSLVAKQGFAAGTDAALQLVQAWDTNPAAADDNQRRTVAAQVLLLSLQYLNKASQMLRQGADNLLNGVAFEGGALPYLFALEQASSLRDAADVVDATAAKYARVQAADPELYRLSMRDLKVATIEVLTSARKGFKTFDRFRGSLLGQLATLGIATVDALSSIIDVAIALVGAIKDIAKGLRVGISGLGWFLKILLYGLPVIAVGAGGYYLYTKHEARKARAA